MHGGAPDGDGSLSLLSFHQHVKMDVEIESIQERVKATGIKEVICNGP